MSGFDSSSFVSATRRFSPPESFSTDGVARRAAQRIERLFDLAIEIPQILRVDLVLQRRHLVRRLVGVVGGDFVVAVEDRLLLRDAFHGVAEHVLLGIKLGLLRQVADLDAVGRPGFAEEVVDLAGQDLQQRRLAGAVQAHDADLGAGQEGQRDVLQDRLAPRIGLGELVHVIDVLMAAAMRWRVSSVSGCGEFGAVLADCTRHLNPLVTTPDCARR